MEPGPIDPSRGAGGTRTDVNQPQPWTDDDLLASTLPGLVDRAARLRPGAEALSLPGGDRATFAAFAARSREMARALLGAGIEPGDRVGLLLPASVDAYALVVAAMRVGAMPVPINARFKARELSYVVRHAGMSLVLADPLYADALVEEGVADRCPVHLGTWPDEFAVQASRATDAEVEARLAGAGPDSEALMLYTSGTTANPKGCIHNHRALVAEGQKIAERFSLTPDDRFWTPLPFFHIGGIAVLAGALAALCGTSQMGHFEPGPALQQLVDDRCSVVFSAFETIWLAILNQPGFAEADLSAVRLVINVGVPASLARMQERFPQAPQVSCFGSTETCAFACIGLGGDRLEQRLTTSGRPLPGIVVRAVDPLHGTDVAPGEVGELIMRGPTRFVRYHDDPEATATTIDAEGWYHSGDLGRLDPEGRVSFVGRLKDMLKVGGENVSAAEVESFLLQHPAVEIVQVVGIPDQRLVEVPAAFVQLATGRSASERELIDFCRGQIATFKVPRYVRFVEEWPMSGTKVQKFRLRESLARELDAAGITEAPRVTSR